MLQVGWIDLHSHVLPGIDDGARDAAESAVLLRGLADLGFAEVCATPHQKAGSFLPTEDEIRAARAALPDGHGLCVRLAAENFWDDVFFARTADLSFPRYEPEGRAFLFEVPPHAMPPAIEQHLFRLRVRAVLPVMAHPERCDVLQRDPERARALACGVALVVDLGALGGHHGEAACEAARALVERGIAHAAASDAHHPDDLAGAADGLAWLRRRVGDAGMRRLLEAGPRRILAGELPETGE